MSSESDTSPTVPTSRHRNLYKISPDWKGLVKEQCLSTIRQRRCEFRSRLIEQFRNIELDEMKMNEEKEKTRNDMISEVIMSVCDKYTVDDSADSSVDHDELISFMDQMRREMQDEVVQYWEELFESFESRMSNEELEWRLSSLESIVCFICKENPLYLTSFSDKTILKCSCGFKFISQELLTMQMIQERINQIVSKHNHATQLDHLEFANADDKILMKCKVCGVYENVF